MNALISNPVFRQQVKKMAIRGAKAGARAWGRSRSRRARRGKWYGGKRLGIRPRPFRQVWRKAAPVQVSTTSMRPSAPGYRLEVGTDLISAIDGRWPSGDFQCYEFFVDPADSRTFPRLAAIASQYQKYRLKGLTFTYDPQCATSTYGMGLLAFVADPAAQKPSTFEEASLLFGNVKNNLYSPLSVGVSSSLLGNAFKEFYMGEGSYSPGEAGLETRTSIMGKVFFCLEGFATGGTARFGKLNAHYQFEFSDPKMGAPASISSGQKGLASDWFGAMPNPLIKRGLGPFLVVDDNPVLASEPLRKTVLYPLLVVLVTHHVGGDVTTIEGTYNGSTTLNGKLWVTETDTRSVSVFVLPAGKYHCGFFISDDATTYGGDTFSYFVTPMMRESVLPQLE